MTLVEHLVELRTRLTRALLALVVGVVIGFFLFPAVFEFMKEPYCSLPASRRLDTGNGCDLFAFGVLDQFSVRLRVSLIIGVALSSPVWLYQLWGFITPGLHKHERRYALTFVAASMVLFALGAVLAYLTLSKGLEILLNFAGGGVITALAVDKYLSYVTAMLLVFGVSFEFPLLVVLLNRVGVVPHARLASWRRPMIFGVFVFAALATPSQDPFTMTAMALPMALLYEVALVITRLHDRKKARQAAYDDLPTDLPDDAPSPL